MIAPEPFKFKCPKCGYSKIVKPKSDVLDPLDFNNICPKCGATMERAELDLLSRIFMKMMR